MTWGQYLGLDLYDCNASYIKNTENMKCFIKHLCKKIKMKRYKKIHIELFGEGNVKGYSVFQWIETSSITIHFDNHKRQMMLDLFSCKPFKVEEVTELTLDWYGGKVKNIIQSSRGK